jgi:hypothetical protein
LGLLRLAVQVDGGADDGKHTYANPNLLGNCHEQRDGADDQRSYDTS